MRWGDFVEIDNSFDAVEIATTALRRQLVMTYLAQPNGIADQVGAVEKIRVGWVMSTVDENPLGEKGG